MSLQAGDKIAHYEILAPIGAGGMGEVYRARDTNLGRDVAIKVLPDRLAQDAERLSRFEREARLLASLNHPNIATLHGFEREGAIRFLVMEIVEGEDLATRLRKGPIPVDEAIGLFTQIADGLGAAHEKGIVHRDLKPANLKITGEGRVKILDFGLAKPMEQVPDDDVSESPTVGAPGTSDGVVLGTGPYMSPEQSMGKAINKQTDVWSFGCCFYEALTARRAFDGQTMAEIIVSINKQEPNWEALPSETPEHVRHVLHRCLTKSPRERLHDIGDARLELEATLPSSGKSVAAKTPDRRLVIGLGSVALAALAAWTLVRITGNVAPGEPPVVVLMDTLAPAGVYDAETRRNSETNADDLNHELRDLPVVLHKETLGSIWDREDQILKQEPSLVLIHRSAFYHAMNLELGYGYPPFDDEVVEAKAVRLYAFAQNKLVAFLGYLGLGNPNTLFLIYSRGHGGAWSDEAYRRDWASEAETRFPSLTGRIFTMDVPVGPDGASFRDPETARIVRKHVMSILGLELPNERR